MRRKVAIVGTADSRDAAPFNDPAWEIWAQSWATLPRWDRWFELHDPQTLYAESAEPGSKELWGWLTGAIVPGPEYDGLALNPDGTRPVYMRVETDAVKGSLAYPIDSMVEQFGPWFWTSTVAYEMALAISEGVEVIALYGIEMAHGTEYAAQKPGCQHFITIARERGIQVMVPPECNLLSPGKMYALGGNERLTSKVMEKRRIYHGLLAETDRVIALAQAEIGKYQQMIARAQLERMKVVGAQALLEEVYMNWTPQ